MTKVNFFESVDPIINKWVVDHKLSLFIEDRGYPIRAVCLGLKDGRYSHEINIDYENDTDIKVIISYLYKPDYQDTQTIIHTDKGALRKVLDEALMLTKH